VCKIILSSGSALHDREVGAVVRGAMLGDRGKHGLMVRGGVDREETVGTSSEALSDVGSNDTVTVRGSIDALEERELGRVGGRGLVGRSQWLDDGVSVAEGDAGVVDPRWSSVVVALSVREEAELYSGGGVSRQKVPGSHPGTHLHVLNLHLDREGFICVDSAEVLWKHELGASEGPLR